MESVLKNMLKTKRNFVFVGEAGCGKSELAINFALNMAKISDMPVHFFDMDQTKPLFRSRDAAKLLEDGGVSVHYQDQLFDAPTTPGGVRGLMSNPKTIVIMDVGGDHTGARIIGAYEEYLNKEDCQNFFVINSYRPWSRELLAIDGTMASVLGMARIDLSNVSVISNPNLGLDTSAEEVLEGHKNLLGTLDGHLNVDYLSVLEDLCPAVQDKTDIPLIPVNLYLTYEWLK